MALNTKYSARQEERGESSRAKKNAEGVGHASDQEPPLQKGNRNEDTGSEEIDVDKIVDEVFINMTATEGYSAVPPRKDASNVSKKVSSADHHESFYSKDACYGTNHERSSSSLHRGSNGEDMVPGGIKIELIDEAEFRNQTRHSKSKIGRPEKQGFESNPSANKGNQDKLGSCRKFKFGVINRDEFTSGKSRTSSRMGSSARQGYRENAVVAELPAENCRGYFTSEDPDKGLTDKSRSFTEKGNNIEDIDPDELEIIDESDFMKRKNLVTKGRSSTLQGPGGQHIASTSRKNFRSVREKKSSNGRNKKKRGVLSKSRRMRDDNDSSDEHISSESSSKSSSENNSTSLPNDEISSDSAEHETNLGVADQTRSKKSSIEPEEVSKLNKRSALPKSTCPEQSYAQNNCGEANKGNGLHSEDQSQAEIMMQKKEASSSHLKDDHIYIDDDDDDDDDEDEEDCNGDFPEETEATDEIKEPTRKQQVSSKQNDFYDSIADDILGKREVFETVGNDEEMMQQAPPSQTESTLPLKFTFEDEVPKEVEKTEQQKEIEGLFSELDSLWAFGKLESSEVDEEDENLPAEESHLDRCNRGKHELFVIEDEGMICRYCQFVALGPKDIMPDWAENTHQRRKKYREAEQPEFDELHFQHGKDVNNAADCGYGTVWSLKAGIRESMYEHQREGFEFLWKNLAGSIHLEELKSTVPREVGGCIISHAPGTGKTRLTINFIETYLRMFPNSMPLIIAPASMLLTWEEEFKKWNVGFSFLNLNNFESVSPEMQAALKEIRGFNRRNQDDCRLLKIWLWSRGRSILGISYSLYEKLIGEECLKGKKSKGKKPLDVKYKKMGTILLEKAGMVVLDEGHTPRNQRSNIWNALLKLKTDKRVILSGTPFQNNFVELFNTLHLVRPAIADVLKQERTFAEMFATGGAAKTEYNHSPSFVDKLKCIMAPFVHVHKGTILQQNLPGLRDCVVLLKPSALQKSLIDRLEGPGNFVYEYRVALISVHPYLLKHCGFPNEQMIGIDKAAIKASKLNPSVGVKIKFILELVRLSLALNEKLLIFSQYIKPLLLIEKHLKECFNWANGKEVLRLVGRMDQKQRQVLINAFNDPKNDSKVMLGSTKCCSEGISLIGASRVVLLDVVWNPSVERQAISRAYRIGQKKFVYTYHLMVSGTTEANKYRTQTDKERLSELVFTSSSNEIKSQKHPALGIEDRILEEMVGQERSEVMFDMIISQPKETDLIQTFGLT